MSGTDIDEMRRSFEALRSRLGKDVCDAWEVYANESQNSLIYRPIAFMEFEEMLAGREKLASQDNLALVAVEVALEEILVYDLDNPRRRGCFRVTEWLTPELKPTTAPTALKHVKKYLDKESGWLRGGPR